MGRRLLHGLAVGLVLIAGTIFLVTFIRSSSQKFIDLQAYRAAAVSIRDGGRLYGSALVWREDAYAVDHPTQSMPTDVLPYVYPPNLAIAMLPLTMLSFPAAKVIWLVILLSCLI